MRTHSFVKNNTDISMQTVDRGNGPRVEVVARSYTDPVYCRVHKCYAPGPDVGSFQRLFMDDVLLAAAYFGAVDTHTPCVNMSKFDEMTIPDYEPLILYRDKGFRMELAGNRLSIIDIRDTAKHPLLRVVVLRWEHAQLLAHQCKNRSSLSGSDSAQVRFTAMCMAIMDGQVIQDSMHTYFTEWANLVHVAVACYMSGVKYNLHTPSERNTWGMHTWTLSSEGMEHADDDA